MPHEPERPPGAFFCTHFAIEQCPRIQFGRERCNTLLKHYRSLPIQVNVEHPMDLDTSVATHPVQKYCTGKGCVAWLAHKSLTWALLHLDTITVTLSSSESALVTVLEQNKLDTRVLQTDFEKATQKDCDHLKAYLTILQNTDASSLASILQSNEHGNPYTAKELATAFTKRVRSLELIATETDELLELAAFLRVAAAIFQRLSGRSPDFEIQPWSVTSLDVDFDADDCRVIGHGAFARVAEGRWNGKLVAVKETCPKLETTNERAIETIRHEVQLWSRLTHPNILPFYGACLEAAKPFIVSQLCASGNALRYLKQCPSASRINLLHDVSVGMIYLHDQGIIHADLKASNILIGPSTEALIADFGLSQIQDQVSSSIHITRTSADRVGGTFRWMAPEVLEGRGLNKPADLYGFALIAWEFYTGGAVPFGSVVDAKVFSALVRKGERPGRPEGVDEGVWGLVERCWKPDPSERPDFGEVERILEGFMAGGESERTSRVSDDAAAARGPISCPTLTVSHRSTTFPDKSPPLSPETPSGRKFSISAFSDSDSKASFLKDLVNQKILAFSKSPKPPQCISPKSRNADKHCISSDELGFISHACKIPSLSRILADSKDAHAMDVVLAFLYNHSLKVEGASEILDEGGLLPAVVGRLRQSGLPENEKYLMSGLLANLACHGKGRTSISAQPNTISALRTLLTSLGSMSVQENATRCLYNLSTDDGSHPLLAESEGMIGLLGRLLSRTTSATVVKNILGCLTNLSHKEPGRSAILSAPETTDALIRTLQPDTEAITKEQTLLCLGNLTVDEKGVIALLAHPDLLPGLSTCLCHESHTPAVKAQALRCLRNLAKSDASHEAIRNRPEIMSSVCEVLAVRASSNQQKYALHFLHRFTSSEVGTAWLQGEKKVHGNLQWIVDNGPSEEQTRAADCLNLVRDIL